MEAGELDLDWAVSGRRETQADASVSLTCYVVLFGGDVVGGWLEVNRAGVWFICATIQRISSKKSALPFYLHYLPRCPTFCCGNTCTCAPLVLALPLPHHTTHHAFACPLHALLHTSFTTPRALCLTHTHPIFAFYPGILFLQVVGGGSLNSWNRFWTELFENNHFKLFNFCMRGIFAALG